MVQGDAREGRVENVRRPAYLIQELREATGIQHVLESRRSFAAYPIAQLDPHFFGLVRCWQAKGTSGQALLLLSGGGLGDALFAMGDGGGLDALLRLHRGPKHNYATCQPEHLPVLRRYFQLANEQTMLRMGVTAETFRPAGALADGAVLRRLRGLDVHHLNALYNTEGAPAYYTATHLREGLYYGIFERQELVAVAGTHVVSQAINIAVVGNVFTHPDHRGRGYARVATGAVTAELLETCHDVYLTVDPMNTPAVRPYRHLGYQEQCQLIESSVVRKNRVDVGGWVARAVARYRGRRHGAELVLG